MKGTIKMDFDGPKTKVAVNLQGAGTAEKCMIIDNLLSSLDTTTHEKLLILALVSTAVTQEEKENEDESRRI